MINGAQATKAYVFILVEKSVPRYKLFFKNVLRVQQLKFSESIQQCQTAPHKTGRLS